MKATVYITSTLKQRVASQQQIQDWMSNLKTKIQHFTYGWQRQILDTNIDVSQTESFSTHY